VDTKLATSREEAPAPQGKGSYGDAYGGSQPAGDLGGKKLFLGGLSHDTTEGLNHSPQIQSYKTR